MSNKFTGISFKIPKKNIRDRQKFVALTPEQYLDFITSGIELLTKSRNFKEDKNIIGPKAKFKL